MCIVTDNHATNISAFLHFKFGEQYNIFFTFIEHWVYNLG